MSLDSGILALYMSLTRPMCTCSVLGCVSVKKRNCRFKNEPLGFNEVFIFGGKGRGREGVDRGGTFDRGTLLLCAAG